MYSECFENFKALCKCKEFSQLQVCALLSARDMKMNKTGIMTAGCKHLGALSPK